MITLISSKWRVLMFAIDEDDDDDDNDDVEDVDNYEIHCSTRITKGNNGNPYHAKVISKLHRWRDDSRDETSIVINIDGSYKGFRAGIGIIVRRGNGEFLTAISLALGDALDHGSMETEAKALSLSFKLVKGIATANDIIIETDCNGLKQFLDNAKPYQADSQGQLSQYQEIMNSCLVEYQSLLCNYKLKVVSVFRERNMAADSLSQKAREDSRSFIYKWVPPGFLEQIVYEDLIGIYHVRKCKSKKSVHV